MSLSVQAPRAGPAYDERASLHRLRWRFFALGLACLVVGLLAISFAFIATMTQVIVFGILLLIAGVTEVIHSFMAHNTRSFALHLLAAALYLLDGFFHDRGPGAGGGRRHAAARGLVHRRRHAQCLFSLGAGFAGWPWVLLNGVVDLVLGALIWSGWPESGLWVIGLFVGIDLVLHGWSWMSLALAAWMFN